VNPQSAPSVWTAQGGFLNTTLLQNLYWSMVSNTGYHTLGIFIIFLNGYLINVGSVLN
jgi:hypothetical protein